MRQELKDIEKRMTDAVGALKERFKTLRTGRANLGMLDGILVSAYGADVPINQVANLSVPEPMPAPEPILSPELAALIELAGHPDALRWAHECGWVPGTGHCRNRDCSTECLFQPQREAEARRIVRTRRRRRKPQDPAAAEGCRSPPGAADRGARGTG